MQRILYFGSVLTVLALFSCDSKDVRLQRFLLQGNEALAKQNMEGARFYFQQAINLEPCFTDGLNNMGTLNARQRHYAEAIDFFTRAISCNQKFLPAYFNRANAYYDSKEYFSMLKDADFILSVKPDTAVTHVLRGLAQTKLKQYDAALASFNKAITLQPTNPEHWVNLGTVKYYQKNWAKASADFRKSLQLQPDQPNALNALGLLAIEQNKLDSAKIFFNRALAIKTQEPYFLNNLGFVYLLEGKLEAAKELINKSITLDPDNAWAYRNKGLYYLGVKDYASAERLIAQAFSMDESVERIHYYYGQALLHNRKKNEACEQFKLSEKFGEGMVRNEAKQSCR